MLTQLEFTDFRGFRQLKLEGLQRVNLIVGKNNSGKTSLLEGITVLLQPNSAGQHISEFRRLEHELRNSFQGNMYHELLLNDEHQIDELTLGGNWNSNWREFRLAKLPQAQQRLGPLPIVAADDNSKPKVLQREMRNIEDIAVCVLSTYSRSPESLAQTLGTAITKKDGEELLESTLREVDSRIKKLRIVPKQNQTQVVVDIGLEHLLPLSQVGQGIYRLVEIFSEVIGSSARVAFIDEVENGIHHSSLIDLWKGIARASRDFDVQVFATTHSYECIESAHEAFSESSNYDFSIIQLFREAEQIQGRVLDREHIKAAIAGEIDLRG